MCGNVVNKLKAAKATMRSNATGTTRRGVKVIDFGEIAQRYIRTHHGSVLGCIDCMTEESK